MGRSRTARLSRLAGLGKTTLAKYKQICDVLGNPRRGSTIDGADMDDKLCLFWLSEGSTVRQRLARVVKEQQVAVVKRHLLTADQNGSHSGNEEHNLRVHLYQPRDAPPGCQRVDWRHHLCIDGNIVAVEGGLVSTDDGALLLALLYFDSGGHFLNKDPPATPSQLHGTDLGCLLAAVIDVEVRQAAASAGTLSRRSDLLTVSAQRSRQFQRHTDSLISERRKRASAIVQWLASLDSKSQTNALMFCWEVEMVMLECDVFLSGKPVLHLSQTQDGTVAVSIACDVVHDLLLQSFDLPSDDSAVLAVTSSATTGRDDKASASEEATDCREIVSTSAEPVKSNKLPEAIDPDTIKLLVASAQQHLMSEWSAKADQEAHQHAESLLRQLEEEKHKTTAEHENSLLKSGKGGKRKKKGKMPRFGTAAVPSTIHNKRPCSTNPSAISNAVDVNRSVQSCFLPSDDENQFPASDPVVMNSLSVSMTTNDESVDSCIGSSRSVSPVNSVMDPSSCSMATGSCHSWHSEDSQDGHAPVSRCYCGAEAIFCRMCSFLSSTDLPEPTSQRRNQEEMPCKDVQTSSPENEWVTAVPRSRRARKPVVSGCSSPQLKKSSLFGTDNATPFTSQTAASHCNSVAMATQPNDSNMKTRSLAAAGRRLRTSLSSFTPKCALKNTMPLKATTHVTTQPMHALESFAKSSESTSAKAEDSYASKARHGLHAHSSTGVVGKLSIATNSQVEKVAAKREASVAKQSSASIRSEGEQHAVSEKRSSKEEANLAECSTQTEQVSVDKLFEDVSPSATGGNGDTHEKRSDSEFAISANLPLRHSSPCSHIKPALKKSTNEHQLQPAFEPQQSGCAHCIHCLTQCTTMLRAMPKAVRPSSLPLHFPPTSAPHWAVARPCIQSTSSFPSPSLPCRQPMPLPRPEWCSSHACNTPHLRVSSLPSQPCITSSNFQPFPLPRASPGISPPHVQNYANCPPCMMWNPSTPPVQMGALPAVPQVCSTWHEIAVPQPTVVCSPACLADICHCVEKHLTAMASLGSPTGVVRAEVADVVARAPALQSTLSRAHVASHEWCDCVVAAVSSTGASHLWLEVTDSTWLVSMMISPFR